MIAKLHNGSIIGCPKSGVSNGSYHTSLPKYYESHLGVAAKDGYYPVKYTDKPEGDYEASWELINGEIVQVWVPYTPEPEPEDHVAARLEFLEECLLELSEVIYA